jgi:hypothetical protein
MEVLNNIITNLTAEKENNAIKITNLLHENEKLKQNIKNNENSAAGVGGADNVQSGAGENSNGNKKYEEIIMKLKKNKYFLFQNIIFFLQKNIIYKN